MGMMAFVSIIWILNVTLALSDGFRPTQFQTNNNLQLGEYLMQHTIQQSQSSITPSQSLGRSYMYISYFNLANSPFAAYKQSKKNDNTCLTYLDKTTIDDEFICRNQYIHSYSVKWEHAYLIYYATMLCFFCIQVLSNVCEKHVITCILDIGGNT